MIDEDLLASKGLWWGGSDKDGQLSGISDDDEPEHLHWDAEVVSIYYFDKKKLNVNYMYLSRKFYIIFLLIIKISKKNYINFTFQVVPDIASSPPNLSGAGLMTNAAASIVSIWRGWTAK